MSVCETRTINSCRACGSTKLVFLLSLGQQYVSNFIDSSEDSTVKNKVPLDLLLCDTNSGGCGLVQLRHTVPRDFLYREYWFRSGLNETLRNALEDIVISAQSIVKLKPEDIVLDIGCNDGTLLRSYGKGCKLVGFEPATNLIHEAQNDTTKIINDYFSSDIFKKNFPNSKCKIITAIAMFYDLDDPNSFVEDVSRCLGKGGIWIIQMGYLYSMLRQNAFDNICHEHLEYYSLKALRSLLNKHNLEIFDVKLNELYGGSLRTYVKLRGDNSIPISPSVAELESSEKEWKLEDKRTYYDFAGRVNNIRNRLFNFIKNETQRGKIVYAYGASTKGNTILQFCNLDSTLIKKVADRDPMKWGRKTIGTDIPIISEEEARAENPDYFLILPWHLIEFFKKRESKYLDAGGKFIVPLPEFQIVPR